MNTPNSLTSARVACSFRSTSKAMLFLIIATFVANSFGSPITFTYTGTGSGSIGGSAFGDSAFSITGLGDTTNRQTLTGGFVIDHSSASIAIVGVGSFSFVTSTRTFFNEFSDLAGFSRGGALGSDLFYGPATVLLDGWNMLTSIGPVAGNTSLLQWALLPVITSGGQLLFNDGTAPGTFTAVVSGSVPDTSSTLLLLACALVGLGVLRRKLSS
jgi:hypothetical protein